MIRQLQDCPKVYRSFIHSIAVRFEKKEDQVHVWWHSYSRDCSNFDQSPTLAEFENWYRNELTKDGVQS